MDVYIPKSSEQETRGEHDLREIQVTVVSNEEISKGGTSSLSDKNPPSTVVGNLPFVQRNPSQRVVTPESEPKSKSKSKSKSKRKPPPLIRFPMKPVHYPYRDEYIKPRVKRIDSKDKCYFECFCIGTTILSLLEFCLIMCYHIVADKIVDSTLLLDSLTIFHIILSLCLSTTAAQQLIDCHPEKGYKLVAVNVGLVHLIIGWFLFRSMYLIGDAYGFVLVCVSISPLLRVLLQINLHNRATNLVIQDGYSSYQRYIISTDLPGKGYWVLNVMIIMLQFICLVLKVLDVSFTSYLGSASLYVLSVIFNLVISFVMVFQRLFSSVFGVILSCVNTVITFTLFGREEFKHCLLSPFYTIFTIGIFCYQIAQGFPNDRVDTKPTALRAIRI